MNFLSDRKMIDQFLSDNSTDILYQHASDVKWEPYNKLHVASYERVHYDTKSDVVVLKIMSKEKTFTRAILGKWLNDKVALGKVINMEIKTPMYGHQNQIGGPSQFQEDMYFSYSRAFMERGRLIVSEYFGLRHEPAFGATIHIPIASQTALHSFVLILGKKNDCMVIFLNRFN